MKFELAHYVQRGHNFAIVDEVDSILIDEARTPLIIRAPRRNRPSCTTRSIAIIRTSRKGAGHARRYEAEEPRGARGDGDYIVDEKHKTGDADRERHGESRALVKHLPQYKQSGGCTTPRTCRSSTTSIRRCARHVLFHRTWSTWSRTARSSSSTSSPAADAGPALERRPAPGGRGEGKGQDRAREPDARDRHLPELLPQVQEARRHDRHADTEAEEFAKIYKLDVVVIPPNRTLRRVENPDLVYRTETEKWDAIVTEIIDEHQKGRPVLVGTVSDREIGKLSRCSIGAA
jgi:preprotein translocase subunit SecA